MSDEPFKIELELSTKTASKDVTKLAGAMSQLKKEELASAAAIDKNNAGLKKMGGLLATFKNFKANHFGGAGGDGGAPKSGGMPQFFTFLRMMVKPIVGVLAVLGAIKLVLNKILDYSKKQLEKSSGYYTSRIDPVFAEALTRTLYLNYQGDNREGIQSQITGASQQITAARQGDTKALNNLTMIGASLFDEKGMERKNHEVLIDILKNIINLNNDDAKQYALNMFSLSDSSFARVVGVGQAKTQEDLARSFNDAISAQITPSIRRARAAEKSVGIVNAGRRIELSSEDFKHKIANFAIDSMEYKETPWYLKPLLMYSKNPELRKFLYQRSIQQQFNILDEEQLKSIGNGTYTPNSRKEYKKDNNINRDEYNGYLLPEPNIITKRKEYKKDNNINNTKNTVNNLEFNININGSNSGKNIVPQGGQALKESIEEISKKITQKLEPSILY